MSQRAGFPVIPSTVTIGISAEQILRKRDGVPKDQHDQHPGVVAISRPPAHRRDREWLGHRSSCSK
jgi:hypothetical protein